MCKLQTYVALDEGNLSSHGNVRIGISVQETPDSTLGLGFRMRGPRLEPTFVGIVEPSRRGTWTQPGDLVLAQPLLKILGRTLEEKLIYSQT